MPLKGLHLLLQALAIVRKRYPDVKLYVGRKDYGRIPPLARNAYERYIHRLLRENDLYGHVVFTGSLNAQQMKERYLKSQVFVLPSSIENSPIRWARRCCLAYRALRRMSAACAV